MTVKMRGSKINSPTIAIIGFGAIARKHVSSIFKLAPSSKVGVLTSQHELKEFSSFQISYHINIQTILNMKPDFAVIATDAGRHAEHVEVLLKSGVDILIEKPIAACLDDAEHINALAHMYGQTVKVAYNLRFSNALQFLKKAVESMSIGRVLSVHSTVGQNLETWRPGRDLMSTASATRAKGGGVLRELSHELDYLQHMFGPALPCAAMLGTQRFNMLNVEDSAMILLRYKEDGYDIMASLNLDFTRHDKLRQCHIIGDKGSLRWDALGGRVVLFRPDYEEILYDNVDDLPLTNINMWSAWLAGNMDCFASVDEGLEVITGIEKIESLAGAET